MEENNNTISIIVPLTNINYYKLELDGLDIKSALVIETIELVKKISNPIKLINQIVKLIKKSNNIGVFDILINILSYSQWIKIFKSSFVLKYYWDEYLLKKIEDMNKFNIYIGILNNCDISHHLIQLFNSLDLNYNYTHKILSKRINKLNNILLDFFSDFELNNYFGCANCIKWLGLNMFHQTSNIVSGNKIVLTLYPKSSNILKIKEGVKYWILDDYVIIEANDLVVKIYGKILDLSNILVITDGFIDNEPKPNTHYNLLVNAREYQKFNLPPEQIINEFNLEYTKLLNKLCNGNKLKATQYSKLVPKKMQNPDKMIGLKFSKCYECKKYFNGYSLPDYTLHCLECGIKNYMWKVQKANLYGMTFFITGIRVKIGLATTLRLLRAGASVIGTTRYPNLALFNYSKEPDYKDWSDRLKIIQADFLSLDSVYSLLDTIGEYKINGFINMAFRTITSSEYYSKTVEELETDIAGKILIQNGSLDQQTQLVDYKPSNTLQSYLNLKFVDTTQLVNYTNPKVKFNRFGDIQDIFHDNSWNKTIDQIEPKEIVECMALNQLVPTLIINQIKNKLISPKFIINVSSFEGQFDTPKTDKHIHTNMCKSALNMLIRCLEEDPDPELHIHTINPGYISGITFDPDNNVFPLTPEDGASRICWPIFQFANGCTLDKSWTKIGNYEKASW